MDRSTLFDDARLGKHMHARVITGAKGAPGRPGARGAAPVFIKSHPGTGIKDNICSLIPNRKRVESERFRLERRRRRRRRPTTHTGPVAPDPLNYRSAASRNRPRTNSAATSRHSAHVTPIIHGQHASSVCRLRRRQPPDPVYFLNVHTTSTVARNFRDSLRHQKSK